MGGPSRTGVVGLGSFIRFRSALKDPRDLVFFFLAIGTGMACGLGVVPVAAVGVALVWGVVVLLDRLSRPEAEERPVDRLPFGEVETVRSPAVLSAVDRRLS